MHDCGRYIYNHKKCGRCNCAIRSWAMAARTCYACETCQALPDLTALSAQRSKALAAATDTKVGALASRSYLLISLNAWPDSVLSAIKVVGAGR